MFTAAETSYIVTVNYLNLNSTTAIITFNFVSPDQCCRTLATCPETYLLATMPCITFAKAQEEPEGGH